MTGANADQPLIPKADRREFFFVFDRPHCLWSSQTDIDTNHFLASLNAKFYLRLARQLARRKLDNDRSRAEAGGTARIFWHHAVETFVTLIGALIQAPKAPHAYFSLCRNDQVRSIAESIQNHSRLPHEAVIFKQAGWTGVSRAMFGFTPWLEDGQTVDFYSTAFSEIAAAYLREMHRHEYNALKHGMRASIGSARLEIGPTDDQPDEEPASISARDSTHLFVLKPVEGASAAKARVHQQVERVTVGWSLERTIQDLNLLSGAISNVVSLWSYMRGAKKRKLPFVRVDTSKEAQEAYFAQRPELLDLVMQEKFKPKDSAMPSADEIRRQFGAGLG